MAIDTTFKCPYTKSETRERLLKYTHSENEEFDEFILNYSGKWAWAFYEVGYINDTSETETILSIKFSREFTQEELVSFLKEIALLGFTRMMNVTV